MHTGLNTVNLMGAEIAKMPLHKIVSLGKRQEENYKLIEWAEIIRSAIDSFHEEIRSEAIKEKYKPYTS